MSRAGLNRFSPHATVLLVLSANAPDVDIIAAVRGGLAYLEAHRGYSHSLLCLPLMSLLPVLVVAAVFRQPLPWVKAWCLSAIGVASHILMDWTNSYGVRLFLPFSSRWFHLDWINLYDVWLLVVLVFAAVWPGFARLVSGEIGDRPSSGRAIALFALAFFVLLDGARALLHLRAVAQLESRLYDDAPALQTAALPDPFNPLRWTGVVETARDYQILRIDTRTQLDVEDVQRYFKVPATAALTNTNTIEAFRYFLYFARFPLWSESPVVVNEHPGTRVDLTDLRFGRPGAGSFHAVALENSAYQVLGSWFTYGSGANLGWGETGPPIGYGR
ncbi:MAG: metal-dependent hydrolase [Acidobacteriaceae bacterium]|nr:metal-dependent hydrolase [Acidobacteriaceae bacterium]